MNKDTTEAFAAWGDRDMRDTAHLMDLVAAGVIDQTIGYGTVTIKPARLEEIVSRIAPRQRDPDGNWRVTVLPPEDDEIPEGVGEIVDMIAGADREEGVTVFNHTPEEIGLAVMENHEAVLAALGRSKQPPVVSPADHGTAQQAMDWALDHNPDGTLEAGSFLKRWREGAARSDWPEYYDWLVDN